MRLLTNVAKRTLPFGLRLRVRQARWWAQYQQQRRQLPADTSAVYCPVAQQEFDCFVVEGSDLLTPTNGARSRHRLIWLYLKRETDLLTRPQRLLHVAPEVCLMPRFRENPTLDYTPADKMVNGYGTQAGVEYLDLLDAEFDDASFDFILCNHVLEHIPDDRQAMREMFRLLRPGGQALITVPIKESLKQTYENPDVDGPRQRAEHFGQWDHVRYYGLDIADRLREAGFSVDLVRYGRQFEPNEYARFGLNENLLVVCKKD